MVVVFVDARRRTHRSAGPPSRDEERQPVVWHAPKSGCWKVAKRPRSASCGSLSARSSGLCTAPRPLLRLAASPLGRTWRSAASLPPGCRPPPRDGRGVPPAPEPGGFHPSRTPQRGSKTSPGGVVPDGDGAPRIFTPAGIDPFRAGRAVRAPVPRGTARPPVSASVDNAVEDRRSGECDPRFDLRYVDVLAASRRLPVLQRGQRGDSAVVSGHVVEVGKPEARRLPSGSPLMNVWPVRAWAVGPNVM